MAQQQIVNGLNTFTLFSGDNSSQATFVPQKGGGVSSIIMSGSKGPRELLHKTSGWLFFFPICGHLERQSRENIYYYDGHLYELPTNGFSWQIPWEVREAGDDYLLITLTDNSNTFASYPFRFLIELYYELKAGELFCHQTYTNRGDTPLPYYAGFYPSFLTPALGQGKEQVIINYHPVRHFRYNPHQTDLVGEQALFTLPAAITQPEINQQLTRLGEDQSIHLRFPDGDSLHLVAEGLEDPHLFPYVHLDSPREEPYISIGMWMGYPNAINSAQGTRWLGPQQSEHGLLRLRLEAGELLYPQKGVSHGK